MWTTTPYIEINSGYQCFIDLESHLGSAASFVQNQRLAYKIVVDIKFSHVRFWPWPENGYQDDSKIIYIGVSRQFVFSKYQDEFDLKA